MTGQHTDRTWGKAGDRAARGAWFVLLLVLLDWTPGAAQHFGRNKVQYRAFDFHVIETVHFEVAATTGAPSIRKLTELQIGTLGALPPVEAVLFVDAGSAWTERLCVGGDPLSGRAGCRSPDGPRIQLAARQGGRDPVLVRAPAFSTGAGLRANLGLFVLRLDYALPLSRPDRQGVFSVAVGPSF